MASTRSAVVAAVLALLFIVALSCRRPAPGAVDRALAACLTADTSAVAGVNLDRLRASELYRTIPPDAAGLLESARNAGYILAAYDGKDILVAARGDFGSPPAGAVLLGKNIAVFGSPAAVRAAAAQYNSGQTGARRLLDRAESVAADPLWMAVRGGASFPLTGNAANLNRLLQLTEYATLGVRLGSRIDLEAAGAGRTPEAARNLEETLRALFSLAAAAAAREPDLTALLGSVQVRREGLTVRATLSAAPEQAGRILGLLSSLAGGR